MLLTEKVQVKITTSNMNYWRSLGYEFKNPAPRWGIVPTIEVLVKQLSESSGVRVECKCDKCGEKYSTRAGRNTQICGKCRENASKIGNNYGSVNKGKPNLKNCGENHPRWNPNKTEIIKFTRKVHWLTHKTYEQHKEQINPNNHPRTLCGVEGGYQLDHKISIKEGFKLGMSPEQLSEVTNLQMLPWKENRSKWFG